VLKIGGFVDGMAKGESGFVCRFARLGSDLVAINLSYRQPIPINFSYRRNIKDLGMRFWVNFLSPVACSMIRLLVKRRIHLELARRDTDQRKSNVK
jgi:hypothetical protein